MLNGHFRLATWLVNHGADPNAPDPRGSALHALAWLRKAGLPLDSGPVRVTFGDPDTFALAQALLEHGANPNARIAWREITFDKVGDGFAITASHLTVNAKVPGIDAAKFQELATKAKEGCPISKVLNAKITMDATLVA